MSSSFLQLALLQLLRPWTTARFIVSSDVKLARKKMLLFVCLPQATQQESPFP